MHYHGRRRYGTEVLDESLLSLTRVVGSSLHFSYGELFLVLLCEFGILVDELRQMCQSSLRELSLRQFLPHLFGEGCIRDHHGD